MANRPKGALVVRAGTGRNYDSYFWEAKWRVGGKQIKRRLGPAWLEPVPEQTEAEGWAQSFRRRRHRPPEGFLLPGDAEVVMRQVIADFAAEQEEERRRQAAKPSTLADYEAMLHDGGRIPKRRGSPSAAWVTQAFRGRDVRDITSADIEEWLDELDEALSPRTVNKHRGLLSAVLGFAIDRGWREGSNPVRDTHKRKHSRELDMQVLTPAQIALVAQHARDEHWAALILMAGYSGLRQGELLALRWREVDHEARKVHVVRSYSGGEITTPKSHERRSVPLVPQLAHVLTALRERGHHDRGNDLVFSRDGAPLQPSTVRSRFVEARAAAAGEDPEIPPARFHDLRHSYASTLVRKGEDIVSVQRWMGHADVRTTMIYLHFRENQDDAERVGRALAVSV